MERPIKEVWEPRRGAGEGSRGRSAVPPLLVLQGLGEALGLGVAARMANGRATVARFVPVEASERVVGRHDPADGVPGGAGNVAAAGLGRLVELQLASAPGVPPSDVVGRDA